MSGKTARRLRKEREGCSANHNDLQTKAVGAAAAAALAIAIAPGVAQATEASTAKSPEQATTETVVPVAAENSSEAPAAQPAIPEEPAAAPAAATAPVASNAPATTPETPATSTTSNPTTESPAVADSAPTSTSDTVEQAGGTDAEQASPSQTTTTATPQTPLASSVPAKAPAMDAVAEVNGTTYSDIDKAIEDAKEGATVTLLKDVSPTKTFKKSLTFKGNHTLSYDVYGWYYTGDMVIDGATLVVNSDANRVKADEDQKWLVMCLKGSLNAINGGKINFFFDGSTGAKCAIYANGGATIVVDNGSSFSINGKNTKGVVGQGIQLDETAGTGIFVKNGSSFLIDGTNRGYVNSPIVYVKNSTFTVQNCTSNASNGGKFTAINSDIKFANNAGHGLSTADATFDKSTLTSSGNGYTGLHVGGNLVVRNGSKINVCDGNGWHAWKEGLFSGIRLMHNADVDGTSEVCVAHNVSVGMRASDSNGHVSFAPGAKLSVIDNGRLTDGSHGEEAGRQFTSNGGGIWNAADMTLPEGAAIYNNDASISGDDIYSTGSIAFPKAVKARLDGEQNNVCTDKIDGWYDDSANNRWVGDIPAKGTTDDIHAKSVKPGAYDVAEDTPLAIKAAHTYEDSLVYDKNADDATGATDPSNGSLDEEGHWVKKVSVRKNGFIRAGYRFIGWNTAADGTGDWYGVVAADSLAAKNSLDVYELLDGKGNDTLYAIWEKLPEPPTPTPKPQATPKPAAVKASVATSKSALPKTGDTSGSAQAAGILALIGTALAGLSRAIRRSNRAE